jgi:hypothetical protein
VVHWLVGHFVLKRDSRLCLYYYAQADRHTCEVANESVSYLKSARFSIINSTDRRVPLITVGHLGRK